MLIKYTITPTGTVDAETLLKNITNIKDLFNIEFVDTVDNLFLLNKKLVFIYQKLMEIDNRLKMLERGK